MSDVALIFAALLPRIVARCNQNSFVNCTLSRILIKQYQSAPIVRSKPKSSKPDYHMSDLRPCFRSFGLASRAVPINVFLFSALLVLGTVSTASSLVAQNLDPATASAAGMESAVSASSASDRNTAFQQRGELFDASFVAAVPADNLGPTVMSGRVADMAVSPNDPTHFYVAYASGGLWRTSNNGQSFESLFDDQASMTIGAIAVRWGATSESDDIWVGTGESNSSRSSYAGTGVYRSRDGGSTWRHIGLDDSHHVGSVVLHPTDVDVAWVAVVGHLYSPSEERGVFMTSDGGENWARTLFVNNHAGAIDLERDPSNPDVLYAATWERERRAWNFVESGMGSGIHKSIDGGRTWSLLSTEGSGFPTGEGIGRIGLSVFAGNPQVIYALLDNQNLRPETDDDDEDAEDDELTRDDLRVMSSEAFLALDKERVEDYLESNRFPSQYDYDAVVAMVEEETINPVALVEYLEDANQQLFNTPVIGGELYKSSDGGKTWGRTHEDYIDGLYNSYGYYFGVVAVSPIDVNEVYILSVPLLSSRDGGKTFESIGGSSVHSDHQAIWVSPDRPGHVLNGNDGGLNMTYDFGSNWSKLNSPSVGQFYAVQVDDAKPYNVYGGLQDNGVWFGPSTYTASTRWHGRGAYPYRSIAGGDGMQVEVDRRTNDLVYTGSQFGFYSRINTTTGERASIRPQHDLGERPLRFNWQTPVLLSHHQPDVLYIAANRLYRSLNQGEDLHPISDDLTQGGQAGDVPYGTIATIDESPIKFGLLYTGSDDGLIHVSRDGGNSWIGISDSLPSDRWVSRVEASNHVESRVYATLNGYRSDEFESYVYVSEDYGQNWSRIGLDLPKEPVNVIIEDPSNEDLLYVGTDHGLYITMDRGQHFQGLSAGLPAAPVHDLKIQTREQDLIVGTHGRSIYRIDLEEIHSIAGKAGQSQLHVFALDVPRYREGWGTKRTIYSDFSVPTVDVNVFANEAGDVTMSMVDESGRVMKEWTTSLVAGLNYLTYDLSVDSEKLKSRKKDNPYSDWQPSDDGVTYLKEGTFKLSLKRGQATASTALEVKEGR